MDSLPATSSRLSSRNSPRIPKRTADRAACAKIGRAPPQRTRRLRRCPMPTFSISSSSSGSQPKRRAPGVEPARGQRLFFWPHLPAPLGGRGLPRHRRAMLYTPLIPATRAPEPSQVFCPSRRIVAGRSEHLGDHRLQSAGQRHRALARRARLHPERPTRAAIACFDAPLLLTCCSRWLRRDPARRARCAGHAAGDGGEPGEDGARRDRAARKKRRRIRTRSGAGSSSPPMSRIQKTAPPELREFAARLKRVFGYNQFQLAGSAANAIDADGESWLVPSKNFWLSVKARRATSKEARGGLSAQSSALPGSAPARWIPRPSSRPAARSSSAARPAAKVTSSSSCKCSGKRAACGAGAARWR